MKFKLNSAKRIGYVFIHLPPQRPARYPLKKGLAPRFFPTRQRFAVSITVVRAPSVPTGQRECVEERTTSSAILSSVEAAIDRLQIGESTKQKENGSRHRRATRGIAIESVPPCSVRNSSHLPVVLPTSAYRARDLRLSFTIEPRLAEVDGSRLRKFVERDKSIIVRIIRRTGAFGTAITDRSSLPEKASPGRRALRRKKVPSVPLRVEKKTEKKGRKGGGRETESTTVGDRVRRVRTGR